MAVEINQASEVLQIKHTATGKWSPATTLLRIEEGFDMRLIEEQMDKIDAIARQIASLATLSSSQKIHETLEIVSRSLADILSQEIKQTTSVTNFYQAVSNAIAQLAQISEAADVTNQHIGTQLNSLSVAIGSLNTALSGLPTQSNDSTSTSVSLAGETDVHETLITIANPGQIQSYPLPGTTRSLVFSGRKDNFGRSHDIYWSFVNGNIDQGKYKILWAYNEFQKTGLSFKDKVLYLSCGTPIQIDVCAFTS